MLYKAIANKCPFWIYYVDKVLDLDQEVYVFKRSERNINFPNGLFLETGEYYFLYIHSPKYIFQYSIEENKKIGVNRFDSTTNWKIYLWGKDLIGISNRYKFELIR